ncbi:hypothetical protein [Aquicoccus sp. SU-CL01552]|uniref:hypothetical protein n=1 Tax=Aquicoccus sp. SU-CL01552 TaxID=3127656 RepID=UPI00333F915D
MVRVSGAVIPSIRLIVMPESTGALKKRFRDRPGEREPFRRGCIQWACVDAMHPSQNRKGKWI